MKKVDQTNKDANDYTIRNSFHSANKYSTVGGSTLINKINNYFIYTRRYLFHICMVVRPLACTVRITTRRLQRKPIAQFHASGFIEKLHTRIFQSFQFLFCGIYCISNCLLHTHSGVCNCLPTL